MRERLIELLSGAFFESDDNYGMPCVNQVADHLLANGVIVPPCKAGDTVYRINRIVWDSECCHCEHYRVGGFGDPSECGRTEDGLKHFDCAKITEEVLTQHDIYFHLCFERFGKTVFLTKEEAERVLKGGDE